jgi:catechol 2,3-dioxygenase-like lactoylglutathione lyase family enzyme
MALGEGMEMRAKLEAVQPVLMVRDVAASIKFYEQLGFKLSFSDSPGEPKYAGVERDAVEVHLQWHDPIEWNSPFDRPTYRFVTANVDKLAAEFKERAPGLALTEVKDTTWGTREFHVRDLDQNGLQFYHDL